MLGALVPLFAVKLPGDIHRFFAADPAVAGLPGQVFADVILEDPLGQETVEDLSLPEWRNGQRAPQSRHLGQDPENPRHSWAFPSSRGLNAAQFTPAGTFDGLWASSEDYRT